MSDRINNNADDGFGLVPVCFVPGPVRRMLGRTTFRLEADRVVIDSLSSPCEIFLKDVRDIMISRGSIIISSNDAAEHKLNCGRRAPRIFQLLQRLKVENDEFNCFMQQNATVLPYRGFEFMLRCLEFRALPYVRAVEVILKTAADNCLSDVHLEPVASDRVKITFRQAGEIKSGPEMSLFQHDRVTARLKHLAGCLSHIADTAQEGAFRHGGISVRVSTFPAGSGERVSLRIISPVRFKKVADLGWPKGVASTWLENIRGQRGLFIISGPVGSGKTTAMYATLSELSTADNALRVVTVEDPVEAVIPDICQSSLDQLKEKDLSQAFKHLLRQDPNVIALGEIRDVKCIREALQAGLSGHLVIATFHAGSIGEATDRIRQMGGEDLLVLSGLKGILHLQLRRQNGIIVSDAEFALSDGKEMRKV